MKTESPHAHNRYSVTGRLLLDGRLVLGALVVEGERIVEVRTDGAGELPGPRLDAEIVSPGLIDLQCNGGFGFEVGGDAEALRALAARLPSTGVTTFLPTVVSARAADYRAVAAALAAIEFGEASALGAQAAGLHLEGPLLSPARAGAHDRAAIAAGDETLDEVLDELTGPARPAPHDAGAGAPRRARAASAPRRGRRGGQPRSHRRHLRRDARWDRRGRDAGHAPVQRHVAVSPPRARRGRRGADRRAADRRIDRRRGARPPGGVEPGAARQRRRADRAGHRRGRGGRRASRDLQPRRRTDRLRRRERAGGPMEPWPARR